MFVKRVFLNWMSHGDIVYRRKCLIMEFMEERVRLRKSRLNWDGLKTVAQAWKDWSQKITLWKVLIRSVLLRNMRIKSRNSGKVRFRKVR